MDNKFKSLQKQGEFTHAEFEKWAKQQNPPYYLKLNKWRFNEGNRWYDSERTEHTYQGFAGAMAMQEKP